MAINLGTFKLPFLGRGGDAGAAADAERAATRAGGLAVVGRVSSTRQLQVLIGTLVLLLAVIAAVVVYDTRQGTFGTLYIASVGKRHMLSQRVAKAAQQSSQGNAEAFKQLRGSRDEFASIIRLLAFGGAAGGVDLPPTPQDAQPSLNALGRALGQTQRNAARGHDAER